MSDPVRIFVAGPEVQVLTASQALSDAYDILVAGGVHPEKAASLATGAERIGKDPVAFAHKFLRLRSALQ